MRPHLRLLWLSLPWWFGGIALAWDRGGTVWLPGEASSEALRLWWLSLALALAVALGDLWISRRRRPSVVERKIPNSVPQNRTFGIEYRIVPGDHRAITLEFCDHIPPSVQCLGLLPPHQHDTSRSTTNSSTNPTTAPPGLNSALDSSTPSQGAESSSFPIQKLQLRQGQEARLELQFKALQRGLIHWKISEIRLPSILGLWELRFRFENSQELKVLPDYRGAQSLRALENERMAGKMGLHMRQKRGEGTEFHQLRDFRTGDSLRQIDWKATARQGKPIAKEFREERDQDVIYLLDSGRRMLSQDGALSHFDQSMNALLVSAEVALRWGDAVGLATGSSTPLWLPPRKGMEQANQLVQTLFNLQALPEASDFASTAQWIHSHQKRRSLLVWITSLRPEDAEDLKAAARLLSRRHIVLLASLQEKSLEPLLQNPFSQVQDAATWHLALDKSYAHKQLVAELTSLGLKIVECTPAELHKTLVDQYLQLTRSGQI
jgi:uncharacterized protein (DUF58 family)